METRETQYDDEITIDLAHMAACILKKWRSIILIALIGCLLGCLWQWVPQWLDREGANLLSFREGQEDKNLDKLSREDAALLEKMELTAAHRKQYEKQKTYVESSPFMKLKSDHVFTGESVYYLSKCKDPDLMGAYLDAAFNDGAARLELCKILNITDEMDLDKMVRHWTDKKTDTLVIGENQLDMVSVKEKMSLTVTVFGAERVRVQQALDFLDTMVLALEESLSENQSFTLTNVSKTVTEGAVPTLLAEQNAILNELNEAYKTYSTLEKELNEEEFAFYEENVVPGKTIAVTGALFPDNPLKKPVLVTVAFGFLAVAWYVVAYLMSGAVKTPDEAVQLTGRNVLALIDSGSPAKCAVDRRLDAMAARSFPAAVPAGYAGAAVDKLERAVVLYDTSDEHLKKTADALGVAAMGLLGQDAKTLAALGRENQAVLLVRLNATTKVQLQREAALCRQYGIPLAGSILVK
ncbi:MAG: hypothetical protein Q4F17_08370 [Eubacteriales bacterium]|nr:hypothetical protein [Eubacteriales bacterium]